MNPNEITIKDLFDNDILANKIFTLLDDLDTGFEKSKIKVTDLDDKVLDSLICIICQSISNNPFLCLKCGSTMCNSCTILWLKEKRQCPYKCNISYITNKFPTVFKKLINNLDVYCHYCKEVNKKEKPINYNALNQHLKECNNLQYLCNCCNQIVLKKNIIQHIELCKKIKINCIYCNKLVLFDKVEKHESKCDYKPILCLYCNNNILTKDFTKHTRKKCTEQIKDYYENKIKLMKANPNCFTVESNNFFIIKTLKIQEEKLKLTAKEISKKIEAKRINYYKNLSLFDNKLTSNLYSMLEDITNISINDGIRINNNQHFTIEFEESLKAI
jgi:hypothetical protein